MPRVARVDQNGAGEGGRGCRDGQALPARTAVERLADAGGIAQGCSGPIEALGVLAVERQGADRARSQAGVRKVRQVTPLRPLFTMPTEEFAPSSAPVGAAISASQRLGYCGRKLPRLASSPPIERPHQKLESLVVEQLRENRRVRPDQESGDQVSARGQRERPGRAAVAAAIDPAVSEQKDPRGFVGVEGQTLEL